MIDELDLVAIIKNNKVFVKEKDKFSNRLSQYKLRFDAVERETFHKDWRVFETVPTTVEEFIKGSEKIIKYKLKDGYVECEKTPLNMTTEDFKCCYDECENSEIRGLYEPVYRKDPDYWRIAPMVIEVIDSNCAPLLNAKYNYHVKFPGYIDKHMIVQHKLPCYADGDYIFDLIQTAAKINLPDHCKITSDYDFHFEVKATVPYQHDPLRHEKKTVIEISKKKYTYPGRVSDVNADNYSELEAMIDKIIDTHMNKMKTKIYICPECQGKGWIEEVKI